jgi:hypothetical protein
VTTTIMTHEALPLHIDDLSAFQRYALAGVSKIFGRNLIDFDGYVNDDDIATKLLALEAARTN